NHSWFVAIQCPADFARPAMLVQLDISSRHFTFLEPLTQDSGRHAFPRHGKTVPCAVSCRLCLESNTALRGEASIMGLSCIIEQAVRHCLFPAMLKRITDESRVADDMCPLGAKRTFTPCAWA